jgi:mono/diheme cytochrome c family protein
MKKAVKFLAVFAGLLAAFLLYVQLTYRQTFEAPATGLSASTDSAIIARGKYLVMGPAHCWTCHAENPAEVDLRRGLPAMRGGHTLGLPGIGNIRVPNITPDRKTGIGRYTDETLARTLRYNVTPKGHALIPFMSYNAMTDDDIVAILSYLRSAKPVENYVPAHDLTLLGKALMRFIIRPNVSGERSIYGRQTRHDCRYGKYLAYSVANCNGCHTERGPSGEYIGKPFAGGNKKDLETATFVVPNSPLTPRPAGSTTGASKPSSIASGPAKRTRKSTCPGRPTST